MLEAVGSSSSPPKEEIILMSAGSRELFKKFQKHKTSSPLQLNWLRLNLRMCKIKGKIKKKNTDVIIVVYIYI
jgi:hypothetical protein